jgi:hypothetical protein
VEHEYVRDVVIVGMMTVLSVNDMQSGFDILQRDRQTLGKSYVLKTEARYSSISTRRIAEGAGCCLLCLVVNLPQNTECVSTWARIGLLVQTGRKQILQK